MKFKSKVDWWMHVIFGGFLIVNIWGIVGMFLGHGAGSVILAVTFSLTNIFMLPMWLNTYYLIEDGELFIRSGFIRYGKIDVSLISSVAETKNPLSAPALSLDRLEIKYRSKNSRFNDTIIISPEDKRGFIEYLQAKNDSIIVTDGGPMCQSTKVLLVFAAVISAVVLIGTAAMFIFGEREPVVTIHSDHIQIRAMYGTSVDLSNVADISLIEESMREIGPGARTNGYNGGAWRGHFRAGLLFVRPNSSPTIRIERYSGSNIFISFRDNARTKNLYGELSSWLVSLTN